MSAVAAGLPENMRSKVDAAGSCWVWTAAKNNKGYGIVSNGRGGSALAHRASYEHFNGAIPEGLTIDHLCRNIACVNPDHLEAVTLAENIRRRYEEQTHCHNGHPLSGKNLRLKVRRDGGVSRQCRICASEHSRQFRLRARNESQERAA
jgi:hypothetical protein